MVLDTHGLSDNMRAREFIDESKEQLRQSVKDAMPAPRIHPTLDNSSPYHSYRYGIALAGSPTDDMDVDGPFGQKLLTIGYTEADREIIKHADKIIGAKSNKMGSDNSKEADFINKTSPVSKPKRNKYGV